MSPPMSIVLPEISVTCVSRDQSVAFRPLGPINTHIFGGGP